MSNESTNLKAIIQSNPKHQNNIGFCLAQNVLKHQTNTSKHKIQRIFSLLMTVSFSQSFCPEEIWNSSRPGCLANDVALGKLSDQLAYYAVPSSYLEVLRDRLLRSSALMGFQSCLLLVLVPLSFDRVLKGERD